MKRPIHLNLFIYARGHHEAAWKHPLAPDRRVLDIDPMPWLPEHVQRWYAG